jgi:AraC-like DNA-binding protein
MNHPKEKTQIEFLGSVLLSFAANKVVWGLSSLCALLLALFYFAFFNKEDLAFFPNKTNTYTTFYTDSVDNGKSHLEKIVDNDSAVGIVCTLKSGFMFPYSGLNIAYQHNQLLDVSRYNKVQVDVSSQGLQHLSIYLTAKDRNVKDTTNRLAIRRMVTDLFVHGKREKVNISLDKFVTPDWWYNIVDQPKTDFSDPELNRMVSVSISTGLNPKTDQACSFTVHTITFYRDNSWVIFWMCLVQAFVMVGMFVLVYPKSQKATSIVPAIDIYYKPILLGEVQRSGHDFLDYIHEHFADPELSLTQISKATGIGQRTISDTISEKFDCNLKTYINQIRINESKRLLLESDLNMSEIAYSVGFNSPANFNRVFKSFTEMSPSEFTQSIVS